MHLKVLDQKCLETLLTILYLIKYLFAVNIDNTVGSIGFVSRIIPSVYPISIIKVDPQTGEPIRDARGLCMQCEPNEPGVFIGKIIPENPTRAFLGYVDEEASKKKIVHDVFVKGDSAFLSGECTSRVIGSFCADWSFFHCRRYFSSR